MRNNQCMVPSRSASDEWFEGVVVRGDQEAAFIDSLRSLSPRLQALGLRADRSLGVPVAVPMIGVELPGLSSPLNWLWVLMFDRDGLSIECRWGDDLRLDDWGPVSGNEDFAAATVDELVALALDWIQAQATRTVLHETWDGRRGGDRWRFEDDGDVLYDSRRFPKTRRAPDGIVRVSASS